MSDPRRHRRKLIALGILAVTVPLALVLGEFTARLVRPRPDSFYVWPPHMQRVFRPLPGIMPGIEGESIFRINSVGLRGDEPSEGDETRILTVGGSTTECLYLDQEEAWPQRLQQFLRRGSGRLAWVGNAGRSGHTTREHVLQVELLVSREPRPDILILMAGVNDLGKRLSRGDDYDASAMSRPGYREGLQRAAFSVVPDGPQSHLPWHKQTALFRIARDLKDAFVPDPRSQQETGEVYLDWRARRRDNGGILEQLPDLGAALAEFRENLTTCVRLAKQAGVRVVLLDQPFLWRADLEPELVELLWMGGIGEYYRLEQPTYYSPSALARGMAAYNEVVEEVARSEAVEFVALDEALAKDGSVYYDDVHYTEEGSRQVAERVAAYLLEHSPFQ